MPPKPAKASVVGSGTGVTEQQQRYAAGDKPDVVPDT